MYLLGFTRRKCADTLEIYETIYTNSSPAKNRLIVERFIKRFLSRLINQHMYGDVEGYALT